MVIAQPRNKSKVARLVHGIDEANPSLRLIGDSAEAHIVMCLTLADLPIASKRASLLV